MDILRVVGLQFLGVNRGQAQIISAGTVRLACRTRCIAGRTAGGHTLRTAFGKAEGGERELERQFVHRPELWRPRWQSKPSSEAGIASERLQTPSANPPKRRSGLPVASAQAQSGRQHFVGLATQGMAKATRLWQCTTHPPTATEDANEPPRVGRAQVCGPNHGQAQIIKPPTANPAVFRRLELPARRTRAFAPA